MKIILIWLITVILKCIASVIAFIELFLVCIVELLLWETQLESFEDSLLYNIWRRKRKMAKFRKSSKDS